MGDARGRQVRLGNAMRTLLRRMDKTGRLGEARAVEEWHRVAGPQIGGHTFGAALRSGELLVSVDSAGWATELAAMSETLRGRINEAIGKETVRSIRFTVGRRVQEERERESIERTSARRYGGERVEPVALTAKERETVERSVSVIEEESLRTAALRATVADLEWKKGLEQRNAAQGRADAFREADSGP